jgi:RalA-binding protein 1
LLNAIAVHPPTAHVLCEFLSTNVKHPEQGITPEGFKEGYLTKRGKNFGGWKKRYFVLRRSILEYYESVSR